jgi:hypothetical protein
MTQTEARQTLFKDIQSLFERTYSCVGINLEDCLIDSRRCSQLTKLAGASARELSEIARTFLRRAEDHLYVGIYFSQWLIDQLEQHDPRRGLSENNIKCLIAFTEEINHALHAALRFKAGKKEIEREDFARDLELQAMVDTYQVLLLFVAFFRRSSKITEFDRRWLRFHLYQQQTPEAYRDRNLRERYMETTRLAKIYTHYLDGLQTWQRLAEIRTFHALEYHEKRERILLLNAPDPNACSKEKIERPE